MEEEMRQGTALANGANLCIHCHICRNHCAFLKKYHLDIGDTDKLKELAYHCFLCGKCTAVCPKGIDGRRIVLEMRQADVGQNHGKCREKGYALLLAEKQNYIFRNKKHIEGKSVLFPGCNFPSFYPETTRHLIWILKQKADIGVYFDCCGKPVAELGQKERVEQSIRKIDESLFLAGAKEIIMVCPNCYDFLNGKLHVPVISIYEKLYELLIGRIVDGTVPLFLPCPDREKRRWLSFFAPFLAKEPEVIEGIQCCGLGGCAQIKEKELAAGMAGRLKEQGRERVFTYCASCAGNLTRNGCEGVTHLLTEILETHERPDIKKSMINRMKTKFW